MWQGNAGASPSPTDVAEPSPDADEPVIAEEKRTPLNHQIVARLMGRGRNDERR